MLDSSSAQPYPERRALYRNRPQPSSSISTAAAEYLLGEYVRMKKLSPAIVAAIIAAAIVALQPLITYGADHFVLSEDSFKIFSYGFPFRVVDCSSHLPMHMSGLQQTIRLAANLAVTFLAVTLIILAFRTRPSRSPHGR
jgi:hypothetical protein